MIFQHEWQKITSELHVFNSSISASYSCQELSQDSLDAPSQSIVNGFTAAARRKSWLMGRSALFELAQNLDLDFKKVAHTKFPSQTISLSHTDGLAVAIGAPEGTQLGLGVDVQLKREIPLKSLRLFLTEREIKSVESISEKHRQEAALVIWTQKEAVFKATPDNSGLLLNSFELSDVGSLESEAHFSEAAISYKVQSWAFDSFVLSVAYATKAPHSPS